MTELPRYIGRHADPEAAAPSSDVTSSSSGSPEAPEGEASPEDPSAAIAGPSLPRLELDPSLTEETAIIERSDLAEAGPPDETAAASASASGPPPTPDRPEWWSGRLRSDGPSDGAAPGPPAAQGSEPPGVQGRPEPWSRPPADPAPSAVPPNAPTEPAEPTPPAEATASDEPAREEGPPEDLAPAEDWAPAEDRAPAEAADAPESAPWTAPAPEVAVGPRPVPEPEPEPELEPDLAMEPTSDPDAGMGSESDPPPPELDAEPEPDPESTATDPEPAYEPAYEPAFSPSRDEPMPPADSGPTERAPLLPDVDTHGLARLALLDAVHQTWPGGTPDLSTWLAANLELLEDPLGFSLSPRGQLPLAPEQQMASGYDADSSPLDIPGNLVTADRRDAVVMVRAQVDDADLDGLGALLAAAAAAQAQTAVWLCPRIDESLRQTLRWVGGDPSANVRLYGLEMYLVRIGGSPTAPLFDAVVSPGTP